MNRFHPLATALALGLLWGLAQGVIGITAATLDYGTEWVNFFGSFYIGYAPTLVGALVGLIWGFIDAFVGGYVFAWLYNFLAKRLAPA